MSILFFVGKIKLNNKVAVVILNYKSWQDTLKEIDICYNILKINYNDIIVVDNDSPNDSLLQLRKESQIKKFILISSDCNRGYAAGNNIGMRYALSEGYRYALILNNDIVIDDGEAVQKMLDVFKQDNLVATVSPDVYSPNGYMFNRDAIRPSFWDFTVGILNYKKKGRKVVDLGGYGYVYRPQGCCFLSDLYKMQKVDFMDEETFLYCEEIILAERLLKKGYRCANCKINIIHNHSKTVKSVFDKKNIIKMNNNSFRYYLKHYREYSPFKVFMCLLFNYIKLIILR